MLASTARFRRGRSLLGRVQNAIRAFSDASDAERARSDTEPPMVFARKSGDSRELRYFVLKGKANPALAMLESSVRGTHVLGGPEGRRYKVPPPNVCNSVLARAAEDASLASKVAEIAEALLQKGVPLEAHTLKALFGSLARADALPEALPVLDAWLQQQEVALEEDANTQAPLQVMTQLMDTAVRAENTHLLVQVLARMARIGVTPSPQSLTTLLQCFMRLGHVNVAHSVLDWMRRNNLEPNVYSYTALLALPRHISESAAPRLLEQARSAYDKMRQDGVQPNARFFTELIRICGRAGDMAAAEVAWADAKAAGVAPDLILYSAMIDTCGKCKDAAAAMRVFGEMKRSRVRPDVVSYTSLLTALEGTAQAAPLARDVWHSMQRDGVQPNGMAIAAFLEILLLEGEIDEALQTLAAARPGSRGGRARSQTRWQRKTARLAREAGLEEEAGTEAAALAAGENDGSAGQLEGRVDLPRLYEHFIFAMAHKGQYAVVEQMARHMRSRGLQQTLGTASALLTAQALQHGHVAAKWLLQPPGMGAAGSSSSAAAPLPDDAVESCLLGRGSPQACMQKLLHSGGGASSSSCSGSAAEDAAAAALRPDRTVANVVLAGLAVRGCTTEAVQLFDWMKQQPAAPEPAAAAAATGSRARRRPAPVCSPDAWTCQLLLYAALNAPKEHQLELTLRAVKEARELAAAGGGKKRSSGGGGKSSGGVGGTGWDRRTRSAILAVMRQSGRAQQLLGVEVDGVAEVREEQLQQLRGMMR